MLIYLKNVGVNRTLQISFIAFLGLGKQGLSHCQYTVVLCTGAGGPEPEPGVLTYFAGAGAGVCSPPVKL